MKLIKPFLLTLTLSSICCGTSLEEVGDEGQPCFENGECKEDLHCIGGLCHKAEDDCAGLQCGPSPNIGYDCGTCSGELLCVSGSCVDIGIVWVPISGSTFMMGGSEYSWEGPIHEVTVPDFDMMKTEVAQSQYTTCVDAGVCTPQTDVGLANCNWSYSDRGNHPVNCVDWNNVSTFCQWVGGRLPSEAEWEYAARSSGMNYDFPWGNEPATCDYAVMDSDILWNSGNEGCGVNSTWEVCSKPDGNTSQGLCDMAGNVEEWVQDWYHDGYDGAPSDGSAWEDPPGNSRVTRGRSWKNGHSSELQTVRRGHTSPALLSSEIGVRCAR
jgi:formylglycine-generating enzyme required for sulfatase activity